jgi:putative hydrolase of the HAD superfamily
MENKGLRIVLDLDDTLFAERDYVRSGFDAVGRYVAHTIGVTDFSERCWSLFLSGRHRGRIFDDALVATSGAADQKIIDELIQVYRSHMPHIRLYADARRLIDRAKLRRTPLGLITDGHAVSQRSKIEALGLDHQIDHIVVTDDLPGSQSKPSPASFELVQRALGPKGYFVYIADNPTKDFFAPNRLGWASIRIQRPEGIYSNENALSFAYEAQGTISSLDRVEELLGLLTSG